MSTNDKKNPMAYPMTRKRPVIRLLAAALCLGGTAQAAEETRTTVYAYDAAGQVVWEIVEPFTTRLCVVIDYIYDGYGNRSGAQPRNCNGTAIPGVGNEAAAPAATDLATFSMGGVSQRYDYPGVAGATARRIISTNALGYQNVETLDPRFGTTLSVTDANGLVTKIRYDGLGRKTLEQHPDGNGTRWLYQLCGGTVVCPGVWNANVDLPSSTPTRISH
jgi:YD repeat-containing protein